MTAIEMFKTKNNLIWFYKLYIELSKDGIGKYFKTKNIILYVVIFKDMLSFDIIHLSFLFIV